MIKLRLYFEYPALPIWMLDETDAVIECGIPQDITNPELEQMWSSIEDIYTSLFIDNEKEFSYIGFKNESAKKDFINLVIKARDALYAANNGKYEIIDELNFEEL